MTDSVDNSLAPRELSLSSAEAQDAFALAAINSGTSLNPAQAYLIGLSSAASRQTMKSFLNIVAGMLGFTSLQSCAWGSLRRHHIRGLLEMLQVSGRAPATINTYLSALKGTAREAWMMKQMDTESYQQILSVRAVRGSRLTRGRALAPQEIHALFRSCEQDAGCKGPRDAAMLAVMLGCGLRRSEVVDLDYASILHQEQALLVRGKGNKERLAFMPENVWQRIHSWTDTIRGEQDGPLFTRIRAGDDVTSQRMTPQAVYHILSQRRTESGIDNCAPHDLRRTFASMMLDNGEDLITVRDAMGHASVTTTQKYDRRGDERLRKAADKLKF
ncbi:integrase [Pantoea conspicua]|uniref:Integrase n=1 Tax=Pantoea conspicua TaxID=472705 RepID=A0A1X1BRI4_9GAMM|nr:MULTISPECIES: tyrosine-type recombinase/integrase [Pantoea]MDU4749087.1 tyrosine-type recombinase/integrase [Pantoea sp.]MCQ5473152.1 tyrosine-type recombinase/integrase [Pantoea brenneri]MEB6225556.1 tyrosine-type recombinase/integrase [Pantoea anthophila]ORM50737.1 integrase [Pantoea conspicua]ORM51654.1 integrase [Pantoea brenneri]